MGRPCEVVMLAVASCMAGSAALAAEGGLGSLASEGPGDVVVTATRTPSRISDLVADVSVIDRARLQFSAGQSTAAFLSRLPGIQFSSNGGIGADGNVIVRGGESRHTLLLIDGMRIGSASTGVATLESLALDQIERIEIVRGPLAALYGADAAAGVIQVFTRRGKPGVQTNASATLGTQHHRALSMGVAGGTGAWGYSVQASVQASAQATAGFDATHPWVASSNHNPDRDGVKQRALSLSGSHALTPNWKLEGQWLRADVSNEYDDGVRTTGPTPNTLREKRTDAGSLKLGVKVTADWQTGLRWSHTVDRGATSVANKTTSLSVIDTMQRQWTWENQIATPMGTALVALEHLQQRVDSSAIAGIKKRSMRALVLGLSGEEGRQVWQTSARKDWNSQFGSEASGSLAYGFDVVKAWRLGVAVGSSFVVPTINQLYYPGFGTPTLQPERGLNRELSLRWLDGSDTMKVVHFENRIRNFIQSGSAGFATATPRATMRGWTFSAGTAGRMSWGTWDLDGALDVLDTRNAQTGKRLRQRADTGITFNTGLNMGAWRYTAYVKANDGTFGDDTNSTARRLPGYSISGVTAAWTFRPDWQLAAQADNLSDKRYQTAYGYRQPGRQVMVSVSHVSK